MIPYISVYFALLNTFKKNFGLILFLINLAHVESRVSESGWLIRIALSAHFLVEGQYHSPEVREEN
jgi:hypothetical protein